MNGCRGLAAVDNLKIPQTREDDSTTLTSDLHRLRRRRDPVVVGEKHLRVVLECVADPLVDVTPCLEEYAHVLLQEASAPPIVDCCQLRSGNDHEIRLIVCLR